MQLTVLSTLAIYLFAGTLGGTTAQQSGDPELQKAIAAGADKKLKDYVSTCAAGPGFGENFASGMAGGIQYTGSYDVMFSTNLGRVAFLAAEGKRLYKPFGLADVTDELKRPAVFVSIEPQKPRTVGSVYDVAAVIDAVVLKSKVDTSKVLHPANFSTEPVEWGNLMGGKVSGNRALANFAYDAVKTLPAGDFDVVVITQLGERKCKVGQGDRVKLMR